MIDHAEPPGRVVLLNGAPSVGKTSLARALVDVLDEPWFHRSLDDFRAGVRDDFWRVDDGRLFERVMVGYVGALRAMAEAGNDVLAEAVMTPARRELYRSALAGLAVTVIAVRCPLDVAVERERSRGDRRRGPLDLPPTQFAAVYEIDHDIEIDTTRGDPRALARELAPLLRTDA